MDGWAINLRFNRRAYLITGLRARIAKEPYGRRLLWLYSALFDAVELPV